MERPMPGKGMVSTMKYKSIDQLEQFEFHDSSWMLENREGDAVTFRVANLNIHKDTPQNDEDWDMELETAWMTFRGFRLIYFEPGRAWATDETGKSVPVGPRILHTGEKGMELLAAEEFQVFHFEREAEHWEIGACGIEPYFTLEFDFDSVEITWDSYRGKAWYELHRYYKHEATLDTPEGEQLKKLEIWVSEEDAYNVRLGRMIPAPSVSAGAEYAGKRYWGDGRDDYLWIDAIAQLQKNLPEGVTIKGCITCRHGNLCPVGNCPDEVFCTKDVAIHEKRELFFYTEDPDEREKRARKYFHTCEDWKAQSADFYTYSDYLDHLTKE